MIAALFVQRNGAYWDLPGVDPWDEARDARLYAGPWPVVAHPPCERWCQLAPVNQARYGIKIGDDDGCFASALASVRAYGGVLEHPAFTLASEAFGIPWPSLAGGWQRSICGGWTCHVEQINYGHPARKGTWLYAYGVDPPELKWGRGHMPAAWISSDRPRSELGHVRQLCRGESSKTPPAFRDLLLSIARSASISNAA